MQLRALQLFTGTVCKAGQTICFHKTRWSGLELGVCMMGWMEDVIGAPEEGDYEDNEPSGKVWSIYLVD